MLRVLLWLLDDDLVCFILLISDNQIGDEATVVLLDCEKPACLDITGVDSSKWNPLLHIDSLQGWKVTEHLPNPKYFFKALCFSYGISVSLPRWFVVVACVVAFFLPGLVPDADELLTSGASNSTSSTSGIADALGDVCDQDMQELHNSYFDPVTGLLTVSLADCLFASNSA